MWGLVWCVCWYSFTILNFLALLSAFIKLIWTETEDIQFFISYKVKIQNRPEHAVHLCLVYVNAHLSAIPAV